jgi:general secretion pathway protein C
MQLTLSRRLVTGLDLLLIGLLAYFAALAVNDFIGSRLAQHSEVHVPPVTSHGPAESHTRAQYNAIVERDVFSMPNQPAAAPVAEDLHLKLLGTSLMTREKPYAIVQDDRNGRQALYRLGEDIPDAGKLVAVEKTRILIDRQGHKVAVEIPQNALPGPVPNTLPPPKIVPNVRGAAPVRSLGAGRFALNRSALQGRMHNMAQLFTQMRAVPNFQNGKASGFRLSEIQPGSLFDQIGLKDGDVVLSINGQVLNNPARAVEMLNQLQSRDWVTVSLMRGGRPMQLQYEIQ